MSYKKLKPFFVFCVAVIPVEAFADGSLIDKIYHPYVQLMEREIEFRSSLRSDDEKSPANSTDTYRIAYGKTLKENLFGEIYLVGEKKPEGSFSISAAELELKWQLTEQGEYLADWGVLFDFERSFNDEKNEISAVLITESQWNKWITTVNLHLSYEWGEQTKDEFDTGLSMQARYRYSRMLEPALELYLGENSYGFGPVLLGNIRLGKGKQINWEAGVIGRLQQSTPETTYRLLIEFEF